MRRTTVWLSIVVLALATSASPAFAIKPSAKPPKPTVAKTQAPKSTVKGPKSTVQAPKPVKASAPKPANVSAPKAAKASAPKASTTPTPTPSTPTTLSPLAQKLQGKPNQLAKLEAALGLGTLTPQQLNDVTSGFKNFGQVNAAVNTVLHNPTVEFADLKALMTGLDINGDPVVGQTTTYSLGQAKQKLGIADDGDAPTSTPTTSSTTTGKSKKRTNSGGTQ
jgi:hypothetical protein